MAQKRWKKWPPHIGYSNHSKQINSDTKTESAGKRVIMKITKDNEAQSLQILWKVIQKAGCSNLIILLYCKDQQYFVSVFVSVNNVTTT